MNNLMMCLKFSIFYINLYNIIKNLNEFFFIKQLFIFIIQNYGKKVLHEGSTVNNTYKQHTV